MWLKTFLEWFVWIIEIADAITTWKAFTLKADEIKIRTKCGGERGAHISTKRCRQHLYKTPKCKTKCGAFDLCYCLIQNYLRHMPLILHLLQRFVGWLFFFFALLVCMLAVKAVFPSFTDENGMERDSIKEWVCTVVDWMSSVEPEAC